MPMCFIVCLVNIWPFFVEPIETLDELENPMRNSGMYLTICCPTFLYKNTFAVLNLD